MPLYWGDTRDERAPASVDRQGRVGAVMANSTMGSPRGRARYGVSSVLVEKCDGCRRDRFGAVMANRTAPVLSGAHVSGWVREMLIEADIEAFAQGGEHGL